MNLLLENQNLIVLYSYNNIDRVYTDDSIKSRNGYDIYSRGDYKGLNILQMLI